MVKKTGKMKNPTMIDGDLVQVTGERLRSAERILIVSHIRPDGDAVGSLLGMGLALQSAGKDIQMVLEDGVPATFQHLPGSEHVRTRPSGQFPLSIALDCSDISRAGSSLGGRYPDVNIDHHVTNLYYADLNLVDPHAVATAEMLAGLLPRFGFPINTDSASALLTGLITDTLGFRTSNMTPDALRCAAELMELGADLPDLYRRALIGRSFEAALIWGAGLSRLDRMDRIVWTSLTAEDRASAGYRGMDDAELVNVLSSIEDADVAIIFTEQKNGRTKVSWRAKPGYDVSKLALQFGGGGHPTAAGADVQGGIEEVQKRVLRATQEMLNRNTEV